MEVLTVEVTYADIEFGRRKSYNACPIARAVMRALGLAWEGRESSLWGGFQRGVDVSTTSIMAVGQEYSLPARAQFFIQRFDDGRECIPMTFEARKAA